MQVGIRELVVPDCYSALPFSKWPALDQERWNAAFASKDLLDAKGPGIHWRPATSATVQQGYGFALAWLDAKNLLDPFLDPGKRWPPDRLRDYIRALQESVRPATVMNRIISLERTLAVLEPGMDRALLRRAICRLPNKWDNARKRARLKEPADLVELGFQLMDKALKQPMTNVRKNAAVYRDGLQIALLAMRPLRIRNFASIRIGTHLRSQGAGWRLVFEASETKTSQPIDMSFPAELASALQTYLDHFRLLLAGDKYTGDRLWVGYYFTPLAAHSMRLNIYKRTSKAFGVPINPHLFRDCAATSIAVHDPAHVRIAAAVLGHRSFATTEKFYNLANTIQAGRGYADVIEARRARAKKTKRS